MLIILFGLAGSGKNFVGEILAKRFAFHYWDADESLPQDMQVCIRKKTHFTKRMRDDFTKTIIHNINELLIENKNLVISQALYKEENRREILRYFPMALFIHVTADAESINQRLQTRLHPVDQDYAKKIMSEFEAPRLSCSVIINNVGESHIYEQLKKILKGFKNEN